MRAGAPQVLKYKVAPTSDLALRESKPLQGAYL
jgi:hypothetical protein